MGSALNILILERLGEYVLCHGSFELQLNTVGLIHISRLWSGNSFYIL